ncbi:hypothetical protein SLS60_003200 [Paraconiothyrium brasiliense]|uniref:Uncharacterized protein n=1 Tax=Paraconiothyrium brasiliense TaxID=300254 RepID=A0ABR3RV08_9PLEO
MSEAGLSQDMIKHGTYGELRVEDSELLKLRKHLVPLIWWKYAIKTIGQVSPEIFDF